MIRTHDLSSDYEYMKNRHMKSFVRIGNNFIDVKDSVGFTFVPTNDGYISVQFAMNNGKMILVPLVDRNTFSHFLLQLEPYIDDMDSVLNGIVKFIEKVEIECQVNHNNVPSSGPHVFQYFDPYIDDDYDYEDYDDGPE